MMTKTDVPASTGTLTKLLCGAAFGALLCTGSAQAQEAPVLPAPIYYNADGSTTADRAAAEASWRADPEFKTNWGYDAINAEAAYARGLTGKGIKRGVIDSGTWAGHPEFATDRLVSIRVEGIRSIDDITNPGKAGDPFVLEGGLPFFDKGSAKDHGTHVGGTIAAERDGKGMHGVAFGATLFAANGELLGPTSGYIDTLDPAIFGAALDRLVAAGARVVNGSWGIGGKSLAAAISQYYDAPTNHNIDSIEKATKSGVVMVFAAGNALFGANSMEPDAKGGLPYFRVNPDVEQNFVTVVNVEEKGALQFSSKSCGYTKYWCLSAPGEDIYSSTVSGEPDALEAGYGRKTGTSMAAPHVTGALGLLLERYTYLSGGQVADILKTTATDLGDKGVDSKFGWGLINVSKALDGPGQFLNRFNANLPKGAVDIWRNAISQEAVDQRRQEEAAEVEVLTAARLAKGWENGIDEAAFRAKWTATLAPQRADVEALIVAYREALAAYDFSDPVAFAKFQEAAAKMSANQLASAINKGISKLPPGPAGEGVGEKIARLLNGKDMVAFAVDTYVGVELVEYRKIADRLDPLSAKLADPLGYDAGLTKSGAGMLILAGQNSYRGDTIVDGGELVIDKDGAIVSQAIVNGGGALSVFGSAADVTVNAKGWLAVGQAGWTADVLIDGGTALVNGQSGAVRVQDGGLLLGRGQLGSLAVLGGGIVAPGDPVGVLGVTGDASFAKDSRLAVSIGADGTATRLAAGGKTVIDGGAVTLSAGDDAALISPEQALALLGQPKIILTSDAGVVGRFERAFPQYSFLGATLAYDPNAVRIDIARNDVAFADLANTANQRATGAGIESLGLGNTLHDLVVVNRDPSHLAGDYDSLSGELHASLAGTIVANNDYITGQMLKRLRSTGVPGAEQTSSNGLTLWGSLLAGFAQADGTANTARLGSDTTGVISGFDKAWGDSFHLGVAAAILDTDAKIRRPGSTATDKGYYFGGYAGGTIGALALRAGPNWASHRIKTQRSATLGAFSDGLSGRYKGDSWGVFGEAGLTIPMGTTNAEPYARIEHAAFTSDGFTEKGGIAALTGDAEQKRTAAFLGLRAATAPGKGPVQAELDLAWRHTLGGNGALGRFAFADGDRFTVDGIDAGKDAMIFGAGVNARLGSRLTLNLSYNGEMSARYQSHSAKAGLSYAF